MNPFAILSTATRRAWDEYMSVLVLSSLWLLAQVLVIPGPPATAVLFAMARATHDGEYWGAADGWAAFRDLFWPAWLWVLPNLLVVGVAIYNLSVFWNVPGALWAGLRMLWLVVLLLWIGLNLYYWPFRLAAADTSWRNIYANCARFWLFHPATAFVLFAICLVVGIAAVSSLLLTVLGLVFWITLVAETAVRSSLAFSAERSQ